MSLDKILKDFTGRISGRTERELKAEIEQLRLETIDPLTDLPQSGHFIGKLNEAIIKYLAAGDKEYFAFIDADVAGLKYANTLGSGTVGDPLLQTAANVMKTYPLTRRDSLARRGGDEFSYIFTGEKAQVLEKAVGAMANIYSRQSSINNKINKSDFIDGMELCLGVAVITPEDIPSSYLLSKDKFSFNDVKRVLFDLATQRTSADKISQGIYIRHPEYKREPGKPQQS